VTLPEPVIRLQGFEDVYEDAPTSKARSEFKCQMANNVKAPETVMELWST
jgi:hypothetical protein